MKFAALLSLIPLLTPFVSAQATTAGVSITNPVLNTTATMGSNFTITWSQSDTSVTTVESIALMAGNAAALTTILPNIMTSTVPTSALSYTWMVPSNLTARQDYALAFKGENAMVSYSGYFTISA
ncbi:uncharacterized protein B0P05DRAFT_513644 [Gilbertella persicaria]|uniref:uncharacterized protein n=1 Tax=Gilbertella persicaria TaxID=101096 RepID=UPI00221EDE5E|nr:uncharacterized protein B0P05DRAFT_513644 [Gilbertella persicaria]KAI8070536.1 hypothetical protein B0P05DRAFT_513644 [Gilbertella persicaria]